MQATEKITNLQKMEASGSIGVVTGVLGVEEHGAIANMPLGNREGDWEVRNGRIEGNFVFYRLIGCENF